jgi:hypothetical protein
MKKIRLTDGSGRWFYIEEAKVWQETDDPILRRPRDIEGPDEEKLYLTRDGGLVLFQCTWWRNPDGCYYSIDMDQATKWLISNGYDDDLPELELLPEEMRLKI